jgi:predicted secreted protein
MAAVVGKDGYVTVGGSTVAYVDAWTLNAAVQAPEVTAFGDTAKKYTSNLRESSLSFSGTLDRSDAEQATIQDQFEDGTLADVAVRLYWLPASYWSGNVRVTGFTVNSAVGDKVSFSINANINGALTATSS